MGGALLAHWRRVLAIVVSLVAVTAMIWAAIVPGQFRAVTRLTVLAGSELMDILDPNSPFTARLRREVGIELKPTFVGSLEGADRIGRGEQFDLGWFASDAYLRMISGRIGVTFEYSGPTMESPVVLGVKHEVAQRFGWTANNGSVSWADIIDRAGSGEFTFAMTDAALSNSGFSALVAAATSAARPGPPTSGQNIGDPETPAGPAVTAALQRFFAGNAASAPSSRGLSDEYLRRQGDLDGLFNYESELMSLNASPLLKGEDLDLVYPQGAVYADYPVTLVNPVRTSEYRKLVDWLGQTGTQDLLTTETNRWPVAAGTTPAPALSGRPRPVRTALPPDIATINALLTAYLDQFQGPSRTYYVVDVSQSMDPDRLGALKRALAALAGDADSDLQSKFVRFRGNERVTVVPFASTVLPSRDFSISSGPAGRTVLAEFDAYVKALQTDANGGTATYGAVLAAYGMAQREAAQNESAVTTIVLMSDGENNTPPLFADFAAALPGVREGISGVCTYTINFAGDSDKGVPKLQEIAAATGGLFFQSDARSLTDVFRIVRGYRC